MIKDIPLREGWSQRNKGDILGTLYSTRNLNFKEELGFVEPSSKLINTTISGGSDTIFIQTDGAVMTWGGTTTGQFMGAWVEPATPGTRPTLKQFWSTTAFDVTSITQEITVTAGTNQTLVVIAWNGDFDTGDNSPYYSGMTANSVAMTTAGGNNGSGGGVTCGWVAYYEDDPTTGTYDVVGTIAGGTGHELALLVFLFENAVQGENPMSIDYNEAARGTPASSLDLNNDGFTSTGFSDHLFIASCISAVTSHTYSGGATTSQLSATDINSLATVSAVVYGEDRDDNPQDLVVAFCKEGGSVGGASSTKWWALSDSGIYQTSTNSNDFSADDSSTLPTITDGKAEGDLKAFNDKIYLAYGQNLYRRSGSNYTLISSSLDSGLKILEVYKDRLYIASETTVVSMDTSEVIATAANTLDIDTDTNENLSISCMRKTSNGLWIGTYNNQGGRAKMMFWNGVTENTVETVKDVESGMVMAMSVKDDLPYILDNRGVLSVYNGSYFEEVGRFDFDYKQLYQFDLFDSNDRWIHPNGMQTINNEILMAVNTRMSDTTDSQVPRTPSGVYAYNPGIGIYHKHSATAQQDDTTVTDMGQLQLEEVGAIYSMADDEENDGSAKQSDFFVSYAYKEDNSTTRYAIAKNDKRGLDLNAASRTTAGLLTTSKWFGEEVIEKWNNFYAFIRPLKNSTDKLVLKYRKQEYEPVETDITWVNTTSFTSTDSDWATIKTNFENDKEYEFEGLQGDGAGFVAHISNITENAGTYTVTLDETITGATNRTAKARIDRWIKVAEFTDAEELESWVEFTPEATSTWIQYRLYMIGEEIQLQRILSKSAVEKEI